MCPTAIPARALIHPVLVMRRQVLFDGGIPMRGSVALVAGVQTPLAEDFNQLGGIKDFDFLFDVSVGNAVVVFVLGQLNMGVVSNRSASQAF